MSPASLELNVVSISKRGGLDDRATSFRRQPPPWGDPWPSPPPAGSQRWRCSRRTSRAAACRGGDRDTPSAPACRARWHPSTSMAAGCSRVRHRVGRRVHVEQQRARNFRPVGLRVVQRAAVVDGDRAGGSLEIVHLAHVDCGGFSGLEASCPFALLVVLVDHRPIVAATQDPERPLLGVALVDVGACGARRVVGVRPGRNVLVPLHLVAALRPFEVELRMVELDVGANQVRDRVRQRR